MKLRALNHQTKKSTTVKPKPVTSGGCSCAGHGMKVELPKGSPIAEPRELPVIPKGRELILDIKPNHGMVVVDPKTLPIVPKKPTILKLKLKK